MMKYRILALLAIIIIALFAYKESSLVDLDKEATKAWTAVYVAKDGDVDFIEKLGANLEINYNKRIVNTALRAAEKIKNPPSKKYEELSYDKDIYRAIFLDHDLDNPKPLNFPAYESRIDFLKSKTEKTKLYARLAKLYYENGDKANYNRLISKAFESSLALPALTSRESLAFALDIIVKYDDVENFFKYASQTPESYSKNMSRFYLIKSPNIMKGLKDKQKYSDYKKSAKYSYGSVGFFEYIEASAKRIDEANYEKLIRRYIWTSLVFRPAWGMKNWHYTNAPILAYNGYLTGNDSLYNYFRSRSISKEQLSDMQAGYKNYVRYTSLIFLNMKETQTAIDLIKSINNSYKRSDILRKNLRAILVNDDGVEVLKGSGLL